MKLWKTLLIAISVAILPFALVGVGQAQQMTCWGLRPAQTGALEHTRYVEKRSPRKSECLVESTHGRGQTETENNAGKVDSCQTKLAAELESSSAVQR
jgi:hypothetical protein